MLIKQCLYVLISCLFFSTVLNVAGAVDVECLVIADTLLAGHSSEKDTNSGARKLGPRNSRHQSDAGELKIGRAHV